MRKVSVLIILFTVMCSSIQAQLYQADWGYALFDEELPDGSVIDSIDNDYTYTGGIQYWLDGNCSGRSVTVDKWNNNIIVMDVNLRALNMATFLYTNCTQNQDITIRKSDSNGDELWTKQIGGPYMDIPACVNTNSSGDILVCGEFVSTVDFDPGSNVNSMTTQVLSPGDPNGFLLKLDANGDFIFSKLIGSTGPLICTHVNIDSFGNYVVVGYYGGLADFDPGTDIANETSSNGGSDVNMFVVKLDSNGNYVWHYTVPFPVDNSFTTECEIDNNDDIYVVGYFRNSIDFSGSDPRTAADGHDGFLLKLDQNGNYQWDKVQIGPSNNNTYTVVFDGSDILITNHFKDSVVVDSNGVSLTYYSPGNFNTLVQKLTTSGQHVWGRRIGIDPTIGRFNTYATDINENKEFLISGNIMGTMIVDLPAGNDTMVGGNFNGIMDSTGTFVWAANRSVVGALYETTFDKTNNILSCGYFDGILYLDETATANTLIAEGGSSDAFLYQLHGFCEFQSATVENSCGSYTSPSGNFTWTATGIYEDTLTSAYGCDSIITVDLTIANGIDNSITNASPSLTANQTGATYRWLDCDNGNAVIPTETSQTFNAIVSGNYAAEITLGSCVDTSACENIFITGIENIITTENISIYPNPFENNISVQLAENMSYPVTIEIVDYLGRIQYSKIIQKNFSKIALNKLANGTYFVRIFDKKNQNVQRIVKMN